MGFFKNLWQFIKSRKFLIHLGIYIVFIFLFLQIIFWWLDRATGHGQYVEVPDFTTVKIEEIKSFAANFGLRDTIIDSVYDAKRPAGVVVSQDPEPKTQVKHNRTIYLYVTSYKPQSVAMPNLVDASPRQAVQMLESYGLKASKPIMKPGLSCVLAQLYKGKPIKPGEQIPKGSMIQLWIGRGENGDEPPVNVPDLRGKTREEAENDLISLGLDVSGVICPECKTAHDSSEAKVYRTYPPQGKEVSSGSTVAIYITLDAGKLPKDSIH